jgi:hypothetical protein
LRRIVSVRCRFERPRVVFRPFEVIALDVQINIRDPNFFL